MIEYHLIASKACGSMIVEAALALAKLPHEVEMIPYVEPGPQRDRLLALNPLGQVPTLVLPDGRAMTESAAIILHLADQAPQAGLIPAAKDPARPMFLRWLEFIVAAIYPTFTYGDDPKRWAGDEAAEGYLTERGFAVLDALDAIAERHRATPAQVALAWLMTKVTAPIASATSPKQLADLVASARLRLDPSDIARLEAASV
jgi:glutathione S-transferase